MGRRLWADLPASERERLSKYRFMNYEAPSNDVEFQASLHSYPRPNGGRRMLPGSYSALKLSWKTSKGELIAPSAMSTGHLEMSIKLLEESHRNILKHCTNFLKPVKSFFRNQPSSVVEVSNMLSQGVGLTTVSEMYPIHTVMVKELAKRSEKRVSVMEDDSLDNWG